MPQKCIGSMHLDLATPPIFLKETLQVLLGWSEDNHVFFQNPEIIRCLLFLHFFLDYFRVLILLKYIESIYLVLEEKWRDIGFGFP